MRGTCVGVWDWDVSTGDVFWSDQLKRMLSPGVPKPELSIESFAQRIHDGDRERVLEALQQHLNQRTEYRAEYRSCLPFLRTGLPDLRMDRRWTFRPPVAPDSFAAKFFRP